MLFLSIAIVVYIQEFCKVFTRSDIIFIHPLTSCENMSVNVWEQHKCCQPLESYSWIMQYGMYVTRSDKTSLIARQNLT